MQRLPPKLENPGLFAQNKMMELFARRDHSEYELREKLKNAFLFALPEEFEDSRAIIEASILPAIEGAVALARERGWLKDDGELAIKMAATLHERKKGIGYINHYLEAKGLPEVGADPDLELEKALALVKNKVSDLSGISSEEKTKTQARLARFLAARGFDSETVRKVIYEKL
jgi:regulatory protein